MTESSDIIAAIRDARKAKGLSQSELSSRIGVPQSHISKIENGTVNLKLSSLIQIARALDLELKLVPRKSLPAVESLIRSTRDFPRDRTGSALSEIKKLERTLQRVSANFPSVKLSLPLENIDKILQRLKSLRYDTDAFVRLRKILESISQISETLMAANIVGMIDTNLSPLAKELKKLKRATEQLSAFQNGFIHLTDTRDKAHRPAYNIEEDGNE